MGVAVDIAVQTFETYPQAEGRRTSAATLAKMLLANRKPEVLTAHYRALLNTLLWKITEANGKYKTQFKSQGAIDCPDKNRLRHDHVYQRQKTIDLLIKAKP